MRLPSQASFSTQASFASFASSQSQRTPPAVTPPLEPQYEESYIERPTAHAEDTFEDVGLNDDAAPKPKRHGLFSRFGSSSTTSDAAEGNARVPGSGMMSGHSFFGRKRGQSGQGAELGNMTTRRTANARPTTPTPAQAPARVATPVREQKERAGTSTATLGPAQKPLLQEVEFKKPALPKPIGEQAEVEKLEPQPPQPQSLETQHSQAPKLEELQAQSQSTSNGDEEMQQAQSHQGQPQPQSQGVMIDS